VKNSVTARKDQTYALYNLTQKQLSHTLMPIGEYTKEEVRKIAEEAGLLVAHKPDSQDICFVPDGDYAGFLEAYAPDRIAGEGNFVDKEGNVLGRHKGIIHYTIGQRKGLGLAMGHPVFVSAIRPETNEVVIGEDEDIRSNVLICGSVNYMAIPDLEEPRRALVKVRYAHEGSPCLLEKLEDGRVKCTFDKPVRAATPGQAAVFYEDGYVLGGGTILQQDT
jgi:tRNA-specific 2-thiouridylase